MYIIREAKQSEYSQLGELMVAVYSQLKDFPGPTEIPDYYNTLRNVGEYANSPKVKLFVAVSERGIIDGGLVYFGDMRYYGAGEDITKTQKSGAFRFLAVNPTTRGKGLGKLLIDACYTQARKEGYKHIVIHSTKFMMVAWKMYERMGFVRFPEIDFEKSGVQVLSLIHI